MRLPKKLLEHSMLYSISFLVITVGSGINEVLAEKSTVGLGVYDEGFKKGYFDGISEGLDNPPPFPISFNQTGQSQIGYVQAWFLACVDHQVNLSIDDILSCKRVYEHYGLKTSIDFHEFIQHPYAVGYRDGFGRPPTQYNVAFTKNFNAYNTVEYNQGKIDGNKDG